MRSLLVTGAGGSAGHNVCWSLRVSKTGRTLHLTGTDSDRKSLELNMWLDYAVQLPSAHEDEYLRKLNRVVAKNRVEVIFPQPDTEVGRLSRDRDKLRASVYLPDASTVSTCLDKFEALSRWHEAGLRMKPTVISMREQGDQDGFYRIDYPCWIRAREGAGGLLSCKADDRSIANHWVQFHWEQGIKTDFVAEEYLPGRDYCFMSIWNKGSLITSMVRERLSWVGHRLVGSGGTSKLNRVVHSAIVNKKALDAINAISKTPHGIFCVDLKENVGGIPCPTEINCRFTTNVHYLTLASIKLGHPEWNFAWIASQLALGEKIPPCAKTDALASDLWFTKNTDMGFAMVRGDQWKASKAI